MCSASYANHTHIYQSVWTVATHCEDIHVEIATLDLLKSCQQVWTCMSLLLPGLSQPFTESLDWALNSSYEAKGRYCKFSCAHVFHANRVCFL